MRLYSCGNCGQLVYFENTGCTRCGHALAFDDETMTLRTLVPVGDAFEVLGVPGRSYVYCANHAEAACNWLVEAGGETLCRACRLNRTIPNLNNPDWRALWQEVEGAKRRLVYALMRFELPLASQSEDSETGLAFDFLGETSRTGPVMTGHDDGLITINIAEADPAEREKRRVELGEPYRTLLGHFRHEVGHYYQTILVRDEATRARMRELFGDERADYQEAIDRHYREGAPPDWQDAHVSSYATMHPWEDFAETWTHYLHIVDTLDTAASFGLGVDPAVTDDPALSTRITFDPYRAAELGPIIDAWLPLTYAVNSLNRSMGQPDLYPFVLSERAIEKLGFIHGIIRNAG